MSILSSFDLSDQKIIVTGAGQGLGRSMAISLAEAGADVALVGRHIESVSKVAREIKEIGRDAIAIVMDVSKYDSIERGVNEIIDKFKRIDVLVNNAGINRRIPAEKMSENDWRSVIDVNLSGVFFCCKIIGKHMIQQKKGVIINIASTSGKIINRDVTQVAYYASKAGVLIITKALSMEWAKYNIRVNSISPGWMKTKLVESEFIENVEKYNDIIKDIPMRRFGEPIELGPAVVFLASKASSFVNGENLVIDGGMSVM